MNNVETITRNFRICANVIVLRLLPPPRRPTIIALLLVLAVAGCGGSTSPHHPTARHSALISIFEDPVQLLDNPGPTMDQLRRLGVQYVRVMVDWRSVAPAANAMVPPAHFDAASPAAYPAANWLPYDTIARDAQARQIGVLFDVTGGAPQWAMGPGFTPGGAPGVWRPSAAGFEQFARAVGTRYSGNYKPSGSTSPLPRVSFWSIWNEPNLGEANLAPQTVDNSRIETSPTMYRQLLDAGWTGLHQSGHAGDTILIGELAPYGQPSSSIFPGTFGYMVPLRFLRALYCVDGALRPLRGAAATARDCPATANASRRFAHEHPALFQASGFAMHPYPSGGVAPNAVLPVDDPDFVYLATLSRLTSFLDRVTAVYGAAKRYPIYSTEYGYRTTPPLSGGVPLTLASGYENWAEYLSWRNPRLRSWDQYLLVDPPAGGPSRFVTGLEFANRVPKPTYIAFRMPIYLPSTTQRGGSGLEVWGCLRPAYYEPGSRRASIQLQPGSGGPFKTVRSVTLKGGSCYFDVTVRFPSGGRVRVAWSYPHGPTIYSRLVAVTAS